MKKELFEEIKALNPNFENRILSVISGVHTGESALISGGKMVWKSCEDGFFGQNGKNAEQLEESGINALAGEQVYVELLGREKKLVVCGAGHVSIPIIKIGKMIGFNVTCIEDRPLFADHARSAGADNVICDSFVEALEAVESDGDTYFVIVTRGHRWDQDCLRAAAKKPHAYIGLMGSRRRVSIVKDQLAAEGISGEVLDAVYTPIGLDIGSETPEEIGVAVMAEIIEVKNRKKRNFGYPKDIMNAVTGANNHENGISGGKVLATIITRKGSAPREVGTKMLVLENGRGIGTIGGGCVEAQVMTRARRMMETGEKALNYHVELTDDSAEIEGMVCGGEIDVFLELIEE